MAWQRFISLTASKIFRLYKSGDVGVSLLKFLEVLEKNILVNAATSSTSVTEMSRRLKMKRTTLIYKMKIHNIKLKRKNEPR